MVTQTSGAIKGDGEFSVQEHREKLAKSHAKLRLEQNENNQVRLEVSLEPLEDKKRRTIMRAVDGKTSNWLTVMPVACHQFDLSAISILTLVWQPESEALFDVRVVDSDAQSYVQQSVSAVLVSAETKEKEVRTSN